MRSHSARAKSSATKWIDNAEENFSLTVENFCKWVKDYLDSKGPDHRIVFLVDEVGQFIGTDGHLMLNLQTITEDLGTVCGGRAWIVVTSQEEIDRSSGNSRQRQGNDFSKIQGRFNTRLSLSSANVDEVIQARLLARTMPEVEDELKGLFGEKGDILKHQLTFTSCGMTFKPYKDADDFCQELSLRPVPVPTGAEDLRGHPQGRGHRPAPSRGERSMLDAFQSAAKTVALRKSACWCRCTSSIPSIESFLDTAVKRTIDQAADNASLEALRHQDSAGSLPDPLRR